jgi:phosphoenolpyruvate carboxykinase (ATP)
MRAHRVDAWLLNTGWTGGAVGQGRRIALPHTRALVDAILSGKLREVAFTVDPIFGLSSPQACPGVPSEILNPRAAWSDMELYDEQAVRLARRFHENFTRFTPINPATQAAGPRAR